MLQWEKDCVGNALAISRCPSRILHVELSEDEFYSLARFAGIDVLQPDHEEDHRNHDHGHGDVVEKSYDSVVVFNGIRYLVSIGSTWIVT